jgi:hypothetical protein
MQNNFTKYTKLCRYVTFKDPRILILIETLKVPNIYPLAAKVWNLRDAVKVQGWRESRWSLTRRRIMMRE